VRWKPFSAMPSQDRLFASGNAQCHDIKNSDIRRIKARTRHSAPPIVIILSFGSTMSPSSLAKSCSDYPMFDNGSGWRASTAACSLNARRSLILPRPIMIMLAVNFTGCYSTSPMVNHSCARDVDAFSGREECRSGGILYTAAVFSDLSVHLSLCRRSFGLTVTAGTSSLISVRR